MEPLLGRPTAPKGSHSVLKKNAQYLGGIGPAPAVRELFYSVCPPFSRGGANTIAIFIRFHCRKYFSTHNDFCSSLHQSAPQGWPWVRYQ